MNFRNVVLSWMGACLLLAAGCLMTSCQQYDDSELRGQIGSLDRRVTTLEDLCREMNQNIGSLSKLVEALRDNDFVTGVSPYMENGYQVGYQLNFSKSGSIVIYHGKDGVDGQNGRDGVDGKDGKDGADGKDGVNGKNGKNGADGHTPQVGVRQDGDLWYWTLDGEWLLDASGERVVAIGRDGKDGKDGVDGQNGKDGQNGVDGQNGKDGKDGVDGQNGKDAIAPQLKIEDEYWWISTDGGQTWTKLEKAVGPAGPAGPAGQDGQDGADGRDGSDGKDGQDGDSFFRSVNLDDPDYVVITLMDGTVFSFPTRAAFDALKARVDALNTNMQSLQTIVTALQDNDYVTSTSPYMENGRQVGYQLNFSKSGPVIIYYGKDGKDGADGQNGKDGVDGQNGKDGADGHTPQVGVRQDGDLWYWTLDGEWLLDASGERVVAIGRDGKDGKDGVDGQDGQDGVDGQPGKDAVAPQLKIEEEYWWISTDGGQTWTKLEKAVGPAGPAGQDGKDGVDGKDGTDGKNGQDGDAFFQSVNVSNPVYIILTLADGTELMIPRAIPVSIAYDFTGDATTIGPSETISVGYTLEHATEGARVTASSDGVFRVRVEQAGTSAGTLYVTAPADADQGFVNVHVDNGNGQTSVFVLRLRPRSFSLSNQTLHVKAGGETVTLSYSANFEAVAQVLNNSSWISATCEEGKVTITVAPNTGESVRTGAVSMRPANGDGEYARTLTVIQASSSFSLSKTGLVMAADAAQETLTAVSTRGLSLQVPDGITWLQASAEPDAQNSEQYTITLNTSDNNTGLSRSADVLCYDAAGTALLGRISVLQSGRSSEDLDALVLEVRATVANDFIVYLPMKGERSEGTDCYIDWGDGIVEHFIGQDHIDEAPKHQYSGLTASSSFDVKITGSVYRLTAHQIPLSYRSAIRAVKQWGRLGYKSMESAFENCNGLSSIPPDDSGAFTDVTSFSQAFYGCSGLVTLPKGLFASSGKATRLWGIFRSCTGLVSLPEGLFDGASSATDFGYAFHACSSLSDVPEIFGGCPEATSFDSVFRECSSLKTVPENLFSSNTKATDFSCVFNSSRLETIPANLFLYNTEANTFNSAFGLCNYIRIIPASLFAACPKVESFSRVFHCCYGITSVPVSLFDNNRRVLNFEQAFASTNISSETPYTILEGQKYHLYERRFNTDEFVTPTGTSWCFSGCESARDWYRIPQSWGGPASDDNNLVGSGDNESVGYENW